MVLIKILVAIILTKLQRIESRANVKKTYTTPQVQLQNVGKNVRGSGKILYGLLGKIQH